MAARVDATEPGDIELLLSVINPACRTEILGQGLELEWALRQTVSASCETWTGHVNDEIVCLFGVLPASELSGVYRPWMVSAEYLPEHRRVFIPLSCRAVDHWLVKYQSLENFVDTRHTAAVRWLHWLGFTVHPAQPHGLYGRPYHRFTLEAPNVR